MSTLAQAENPRGGSGEAGIRSDPCTLVCVLHQRLGIPLCRKRMTEGPMNPTALEAKRRAEPKSIITAGNLPEKLSALSVYKPTGG
jgi:hypothetical protein